MIRRSISFITRLRADRRSQLVVLVAYYLVIQLGIFLLYAWSSFTTPAFIYQGF